MTSANFMEGIPFNITLIHPNGELRIVPVEYVCDTYVTVRWGGAGVYDLNLLRNVLTPRTGETQPNGKGRAKWYKKDAPKWKAQDIEMVRAMVKERLGKGAEEREARAAKERHECSMPGLAVGAGPGTRLGNTGIAFVPGAPQPSDLNFIPRVFGKTGRGPEADKAMRDATDRAVLIKNTRTAATPGNWNPPHGTVEVTPHGMIAEIDARSAYPARLHDDPYCDLPENQDLIEKESE